MFLCVSLLYYTLSNWHPRHGIRNDSILNHYFPKARPPPATWPCAASPPSLPPCQHHSPRTRSPQFAQRHRTRRSANADCGEELECKYTVNGSVVASVYVRQYRKLCTYLTRVSGSVRPTREANRGTPLPVSSVHSLSPNLPVWPLTPSQRGSHKPSPSLTSPSTFGCGSSSISLVTVYYFPRWDSLRLHRELVYPLLTILPAPLNVSRNTHRT